MKKNISLIDNIVKLKTKKDAIILSHNYQIDEIQDIADFVGDSLQLSIKASKVKNRIIVFCGVHFMAETAKIISPEKKVLLPDKNSGCPMADMITDKQLANLKKEHPGAVVVCYVNTSARVKALSDICCTSSNAVKVVNSIPPDKQIIFIPDKYLGSYVQSQTGRTMILWNGFCPTHAKINVETIIALKKEHPDAIVLVHPECTPDVIAIADAVASTGGMLSFAEQSTKKEFIIGTEIGLIYRLKKENPDKVFYPASSRAICPNMKLTNLEKLLWALEEERFEIKLPQDIIDKARMAIDNMLALS
ncbi:MAG: quinolinate synthase NadA [Actinobacteria bacterium]|nr:quinolinate synthase NadA [Actinomycetota bacterium]